MCQAPIGQRVPLVPGTDRTWHLVTRWPAGYASGLRARLGATRGGSFGIFGYTGGQGASIIPLARSWADRSSSEERSSAVPAIAAHGSPCTATRAGTVATVSSSGSTVPSSSHANGVDNCPPTRGRAPHAENTVLWGAFWL